MATIQESIDVEVPVETAYNQWTQFEEFPHFMDGSRHEWDALITEQHPDERVAWRNPDGKENAGVVTFHKLADDRRA